MKKAKRQQKQDLEFISGARELEDEVLEAVTGGVAVGPSCTNGGGCNDGGGCDDGGVGGIEFAV